MAKEKVYKLAQEFRVSSEALMQLLRTMGIPVKSHMSTVDESLRDEIKKRFDSERADIKKQYDRKKQLITKAREEQEATAAAAAAPTAPTAAAPESQTSAPTQSSAPQAPAATMQPAHPAARILRRPDAAPQTDRAGAPPSREGFNRGPSREGQQDQRFARPSYPNRSGTADRGPDRSGPRGPFVPRGPRLDRPPVGGPGSSGSFGPRRSFGGPPRGGPGSAPAAPPKPGSTEERTRRRKPAPKKQRYEKPEVDAFELKANVRRTLAQIGAGVERRKYRKERGAEDSAESVELKLLKVSEFVTVSELANILHEPVTVVIAKCLELGLFVTANQRLDFDTISMVADEFGYQAQLMEEYTPDLELTEEKDDPAKLKPRAPVVTVMGHVDHGKTSLLDFVRKTNVMSGEAGGITQHIAAYEVKTAHGPVTFLDTPGHEAFTAMRARGSQSTDVVVLVVAADSGVMPQTKEAIDHARAANVPLVVAINKMDLPTANPDKIKNELAAYNVLVEDYGGKISCVPISARTGEGVDRLLETLALEAEILDLKANPDCSANGVVIESELDKGKGPIATILIQRGTLHRGDAFVTGIHSGRVRELQNERGVTVMETLPGQPVIVLGLSGTPQAGDSFTVVEDEKTAREISARRRLAQKEREMRKAGVISLDHLHEQIQAGKVQTLNLIIKGDVDGSVEALATSLERLSTDEVKLRVIHKSVGAIKEADIMLAEASDAIIIGFHLSPNPKIREIAKREGVDIRLFRIIYEAIDQIKKALEGMLTPELKETIVGQVEVRRVFKVSRVGSIAGCAVLSGKITRNAKARLIREDVEVADTTVSSLRRNSDDAREVAEGYECGVTLQGVNDYHESDRIEIYETSEVARKLA